MRSLLIMFGFLWASMASAEVPHVATDIAPVHSLVARVMDGVGQPEVIVRPGASPHGYALRPSEAAALARADLVVWMGDGLTPWLKDAVATLAGDARQVALLKVKGTQVLHMREGAAFAVHAHEGHAHDGHEEDEAVDPHAWLDPVNGQFWLQVIASELAALDPLHAETYKANAVAGQEELALVIDEIDGMLAQMQNIGFLVFHDAYQYFEARFHLAAAGALADGDAAPPGPARLVELRDLVVAQGITCVLSEPQFDPRLVRSVFGDAGIAVGVLDPMGAGVAPGKTLYPTMLKALAAGIADCIGSGG